MIREQWWAYLLVVALTGVVVLACARVARADGSPVSVPTASPAPVASPALRAWSLGWAAQAAKNRKGVVRARRCFGLPTGTVVPHRPRTLDREQWLSFGRECKRLAYRWHRGFHRLRHRMAHPRVLSAYSWRPLVRWYWPASLVETALHVIRLESGGNPAAQNHSSGAGGLFQLHPPPYRWWDPDVNVRLGYQKYRSQGWHAWVVMW